MDGVRGGISIQGLEASRGFRTSESIQPFFFLNFLTVPHGMWDLNSPTRDQTHTACIERQSLTTGLQGSPHTTFLISKDSWYKPAVLKMWSPYQQHQYHLGPTALETQSLSPQPPGPPCLLLVKSDLFPCTLWEQRSDS